LLRLRIQSLRSITHDRASAKNKIPVFTKFLFIIINHETYIENHELFGMEVKFDHEKMRSIEIRIMSDLCIDIKYRSYFKPTKYKVNVNYSLCGGDWSVQLWVITMTKYPVLLFYLKRSINFRIFLFVVVQVNYKVAVFLGLSLHCIAEFGGGLN
jgi:hypothetical protein